MFAKSIRWRLQLWLGFLLICILSGFGVTAYQLHRTNQLTQIDQELKRRVELVSSALRYRFGGESRSVRPPPGWDGRDEKTERHPPREPGEPGGQRSGPGPGPGPGPGSGRDSFVLPAQVLALFDESARDSYYFIVWSRSGDVLQSSANAPETVPVPPAPVSRMGTLTRMRGPFRESFYRNSLGECVLAGRDVTVDFAALRGFTLWLLAAGGTVLALGLGGGWWLTTKAIRPVEDISAAASRISAGNLSERITGADPENELGRLAAVLNKTFARLEAAFAQQKQFTADASHELRTPLSVLIAEAQTTLSRERSNAEYRETIEANLAAAQQMRHLTESLLTLARLDAGQEAKVREAFDLGQKAQECIDRIRPLANERGIRIHSDLRPVSCQGDPAGIGQVITNLLVNAIHYNRPAGEVRVVVGTDQNGATLRVTDTGIGIAPDDRPHVFERFYRADKSRSRAEGRSGLGLAISKAIVEAQGGSLELSSESGVGSTFTVNLPA